MPYNSELLNVIDYRIAQNSERMTAMGTVSSRSTIFYDNAVMVTFDGSALAVPVKTFANVECWDGDRVGLVKFGSEWVIVGTFTKRWPEFRGVRFSAITATQSSVSYADYPNAPSLFFQKRYADTGLWMELMVTCYVNVIGTAGAFGLQFTDDHGVNVYYSIASFGFGTTNRETICGDDCIYNISPGNYYVTPQWAYVSGPGALQTGASDDRCHFAITETTP